MSEAPAELDAQPTRARARPPVRIAAIVLAAGDSSRMGPERNKLVEVIAGRPLVAWPVDALQEAGVAPIVVVTGFEADRIRVALASAPRERACRFVHHAGWREGMGSSLARGMQEVLALRPRPEAVLVCVGDLPGLRASHVEAVVDAARAANGAIDPRRIVVPTHRGRRGHPVLFGEDWLEALARQGGDEGARSIIGANPDHVRSIEVGTDALLRDVDTPDDLGEARSRSVGPIEKVEREKR